MFGSFRIGSGSGNGKKNGKENSDNSKKTTGSSSSKTTPGGVKRGASKSPPQPPPRRQNTGGSSSSNTAQPPGSQMSLSNITTASSVPPRTPQDPRMSLYNITTASSARGQLQQAAPIQPPIPRQVWYCCQCLVGRKGNPPIPHEMYKTECGFPNPHAARHIPCPHKRCSQSCLTQRAEEEPPMWCLGLDQALKIPPWGRFPWTSYLPFRTVLRLQGSNVWPTWWCCKCKSNKENDTRNCLFRKMKKVCQHAVCGGCSPNGQIPGRTDSPPPGRGRKKGQQKPRSPPSGGQDLSSPQVTYRY